MDAVYAEDGSEFSFEELRAHHRGWMQVDWRHEKVRILQENANPKTSTPTYKSRDPEDLENLTYSFDQKLDITESTQSQESLKGGKAHKQKKIKLREVKQETQTVKTRLDSPGKRKVRRKVAAEPTMTFNSKAAHNDIYEMYNNASHQQNKHESQSGVDTDFEDDTFSVAGESTGTGRMSTTNSEFGDDTTGSVHSFGADDVSDSPWSDFTTGKISKVLKKARSTKHRREESEDFTNNMSSSQDQALDGFDTQAIADLANQDFGEFDTMAIARIAGTLDEDQTDVEDVQEAEDLKTPVEPLANDVIEVKETARFVPIPPEEYEPTPLRPYRDRDFVAHNKLPFMTPIVEQTESSLAAPTIYHDHFSTAKTPSRSTDREKDAFESPSRLNVIDLLLESPQPNSSKRKNDEEEDEKDSPKKIVVELVNNENQKILFPVTKVAQSSAEVKELDVEEGDVFKTRPISSKPVQTSKRPVHKGPIIHDAVCNPCDESITSQILKVVYPGPSSYQGFSEYNQTFNRFAVLQSYVQKLARLSSKTSPRKPQKEKTSLLPPMLTFGGSSRVYAVKRQLGEGAYAPVYLAESSDQNADNVDTASGRGAIEAIKVEDEPRTLTWEFHILQLLKSRLGPSSRTMESIVLAHECHLYRDECYLILDYYSQGTLLNLVNHCRNENIRAGKTAEGLEEPVVMWLAVELLRTMEDMHKVGILHGDLKADNCLVRLDPETELSEPYNRYGDNGWSKKGLTLIDLGRGIDTRAFKPDAQFIADWKAEESDCAEIREAKPWKWQIDLFGAAGIIHSLLFGKYIETVLVSGGGLGQKKEWKIRENFKRYWEKDIWSDVFSTLINGGGKQEDEIRKDLQRVRRTMEDWLEKEGERNGRDLRGALKRCERLIVAGNGAKGRR